MANSHFEARIDVREYSSREKHPAIFRTFDSLNPGETMELINDHNPKPLLYEFKIEREGIFTWDYLEEGPEVWRISIGRVEGGA
ncbi:MAG TPA: DUF2249 domain-containing protein [Bacillales bacterium]